MELRPGNGKQIKGLIEPTDIPPTKKAAKLEEVIYARADEKLQKDVKELVDHVHKFLINHGAGLALAMDSYKALHSVEIDVTLIKGAGTSKYNILSGEFLKQLPNALTTICQQPCRNRELRNFVTSVEEVEDIQDRLEFVEHNARMDP